MPLTEIGPRGYHQATGSASVTFAPQSDRAAIVRKVIIDAPSASDTWRFKVNGREIGNYVINTTGNQQLLGAKTGSSPKNSDIFDFLKARYDMDLIYPVPQGATLTVASDGGATADVLISYTEHVPGEVGPGLMNHPNGNRFVAPIYANPKSSITAAGDTAFASQSGLSFVPTFFTDASWPQGWQMRILGLFFEGGGVNTYSGSADHQSVTDHIAVTRNGQVLFTRDSGGGLPLVGTASAAGSANKVYNADLTAQPAFQIATEYDWNHWEQPLQVNPGDLYQWRLNLTGSFTGGADYSTYLQVAIVDVVGSGL